MKWRVKLVTCFTVNGSTFAQIDMTACPPLPLGKPFRYEAEQRVDGRKFFKIGIEQQPTIIVGPR